MTWSQIGVDGLGNANNSRIGTLTEFRGNLYATTQNNSDGAEVWRSYDGDNWELVVDDGFGDAANNLQVRFLAEHDGKLYIGTGNDQHGTASSGELFRYDIPLPSPLMLIYRRLPGLIFQ